MSEYQIGKDMAALTARQDLLERKVEIMGAQTTAALAELDSALEEVAGELEDLADTVAQDDATSGEAIRARATRLRDLRPSDNVPVDADPATPVDPGTGIVTDDQGNPPL